ncbi:MAG: hypothetical protein M8861_02325, partial [marine benthic group bacterium]|nr:hypothetical protein [Gemmatimonadota bacterium]
WGGVLDEIPRLSDAAERMSAIQAEWVDKGGRPPPPPPGTRAPGTARTEVGVGVSSGSGEPAPRP